MVLLLCLAVGAALVIWVSGRLRELEEKNAEQQRQIAALTARVFRLEGGTGEPATAPPVMPPRAAADPARMVRRVNFMKRSGFPSRQWLARCTEALQSICQPQSALDLP